MPSPFFYCLGSTTNIEIYRHPEALEDVEDDNDERLPTLPSHSFVNGS